MIVKVVFGLSEKDRESKFVSAFLYRPGETSVNLLSDPRFEQLLESNSTYSIHEVERVLLELIEKLREIHGGNNLCESVYDANEEDEADVYYRYHLLA